ncbi:MAG: type VI secretion system tip protein VgrG [Deltaproteobacteria bacterium]|nr:type VI secretion system tip protein VgrG [Deltaproteobacteria bacterium]
MARSHSFLVELGAGPLAPDDLEVRSAKGTEEISGLFSFEVDFTPREGVTVELADLPQKEATLALRWEGGAERRVHGEIWSAELSGVTAGRARYRVRIAPRLERLRLVRRSRVFQDLSLPDVVQQVLDDAGVKVRAALSRSHAPRELCIQYRETDLDFVSRLLEEAGVFTFFEHATDGHTLVLADGVDGCGEIEGETRVVYRGSTSGTATEQEHVGRLEAAWQTRTGKVSLRDFDFERPDMEVSASQAIQGDDEKLERYEYPGGFLSAGGPVARLRLEEERSDAATLEGSATCPRFLPGAHFEVAETHGGRLDGKLLLLRVSHEVTLPRRRGEGAESGLLYRNRFQALQSGVPFRPRRATPRPRAITETAWAVGPAGEEVHTDEHGRVKVQFHWDRDGQRDDHSSCFVRCAQRWAGAGQGALFLPRAGQEVLVRFLHGDPDSPLVTGAVYNAMSPPPLSLPGEKTRSTLRSDSSPGGQGANELRLEDQKGAEEIMLHAQRDLRVEVENDETAAVLGAEAQTVSKDRTVTVQGQRRVEVEKDDKIEVRQAQVLTVAGDRTTRVLRDQRETVAGQAAVTVGGERALTAARAGAETIGGAGALTVGGAYGIQVGGVLNVAVGGACAVEVGGDRLELVGAARQEVVGGNGTLTVKGDAVADVQGQAGMETGKDHDEAVDGELALEIEEPATWAAKELTLEADKLSLVVGGKVALSVDKGGNVTFGAAKFSLDASGDLVLKGGKLKMDAAGSASSATPQVPTLDPLEDPRAVVEFTLRDQNGNPIRNEPYQVELPDGEVKKGRTDANGHARVSGKQPGTAKVTFPQRDKSAVRSG